MRLSDVNLYTNVASEPMSRIMDLDKDLNSADVDDKGAWSSIHDENIREEIQRDVSPVSFRKHSYQSFENAKTSDSLNERYMITDIIFCNI